MKATIEKTPEGEVLMISIPINPHPSHTGRSTVIATTEGNQPVPGLIWEGKQVTLGLNAYVRRDRR